jgi:hypothetical protein
MTHLGRHAIVVGASMGGLLARRALVDYYDEGAFLVLPVRIDRSNRDPTHARSGRSKCRFSRKTDKHKNRKRARELRCGSTSA